MNKNELFTDAQVDRMNDYQAMKLTYCPKCDRYRNKEIDVCPCESEKPPVDVAEKFLRTSYN